MRPAKTIKYVATLARSKVGLENIKLAIEIFGLIFLLATVGASVWLAFLQRDANTINKQEVGLNQKALDLSQKSLELAQKSVGLTQQSLALTQQSVKASEQALHFASKANDISEKGLTAANTPSVGMRIDRIEYKSDQIIISYTLTNHSALVANYINTDCFLEGVKAPDLSMLTTRRTSIMPNDSFQFYAQFFPEEVKATKKGIESGEINIQFLVQYKGPLNTRSNFTETFVKDVHSGGFAVENLEPDIDFDKTFIELMNATKRPRKN